MIRYDLLVVFRTGAQSLSWYWPTAQHAVAWAAERFPEAKKIEVAWSAGSGLQIQGWTRPELRLPDAGPDPEIDSRGRWAALEIDP